MSLDGCDVDLLMEDREEDIRSRFKLTKGLRFRCHVHMFFLYTLIAGEWFCGFCHGKYTTNGGMLCSSCIYVPTKKEVDERKKKCRKCKKGMLSTILSII